MSLVEKISADVSPTLLMGAYPNGHEKHLDLGKTAPPVGDFALLMQPAIYARFRDERSTSWAGAVAIQEGIPNAEAGMSVFVYAGLFLRAA